MSELLYDKKLNNILDKYKIKVKSEAQLSDNLEGIIIEVLTKKCKGKVCALWGAGQNNTKSSHAAILIAKYATFIQNMVCVIDSNTELHGKQFLGYPIIAPNQMKDYKVDLVIIASKNSGTSIKKNLLELDSECGYIDIYEELRLREIEVYNNFYDENSIYTQIYNIQIKYQQEGKQEDLRYLISLYLSIRDFYYAEKYMKKYINLSHDDYHNYELLLSDLNNLFSEMKEQSVKRYKDVSMFYIDALRGREVFDEENRECQIFKRYCNYGKVFTNIYSTAVTTYESMMSVISGKYPLETQVYTNDFLHEAKDFKLLAHYEEMKYNINFMVSECYRIVKETDRINYYLQNYMPQKLWTLACQLAESLENTFNFVYFPYEVHFPLLCGYHKELPVIKAFSDLGIEEFPESIEQQYLECVDYTDKQFEFYYDFLGPNSVKVIFSDHSQVVYDKSNDHKTYNMYYKYKELTTHVPLIVSSESWKQEEINELYSMIDFNNILLTMLNGSDISELKKEIVRYQYYPMHNPKMREHARQYKYDNYIDGIDAFLSRNYLYIVTATGTEEVYELKDLSTNIVNTQNGQAYIRLVNQQYLPIFQRSKDGNKK